jgi:ankyrin repeat protein
MNVLAVVVYAPIRHRAKREESYTSKECPGEESDVYDHARTGNLANVKQAIEVQCARVMNDTIVMNGTFHHFLCFSWQNGFDPRESLDRNGASLLLWAAGSGHLHVVKYLIEECSCHPDHGQEGKRSFSGRTSLHWSARNGHLNVVQYLVDKCDVDIDASTADGTTAFCWASWQGHLKVMKFMHQRGADVHKANSFGCTAVLWCAQGEGTVEIMDWLQSIGLSLVTTNSNGHGALHKSAQRKRSPLCSWLCSSVYENLTGNNAEVFNTIGPDTEGCCPSDLAGMAGDEELALFIAKQETRLVRQWSPQILNNNDVTTKALRLDNHLLLPKWLQRRDALVKYIANESELNVWESWGGARRMQLALRSS